MPICPSCGQENPEGFRFCGACGAPLDSTVAGRSEERKVVTVLFCDLVGSTALAERQDPEDVRALLSRYHERVRHELERFGGTVEKFIGDAVMALFGAPTTHEDDPERAVRAALAIREWTRDAADLRVRIGITTGEALVALGASPQQGEAMAAGDVVNTAARLQSAAPVDGILVDETTYRATERAIEYAPAPAVEAKGKAEPVTAWEAREARASLGVDVAREAAAPLVGRDAEVEGLRSALSRARRERATQLVTLVGVPGIGKSRLVVELLRAVEDDDELIFWRQGRCLPYGEGVSFWALGEMVKAQAGILETDTEDGAAEKLARAVADIVEDEDEVRRVSRHLRPLVGLGGDERAGEQGEAFSAWRRFFEALAESGPAVLVFEDLHWADEGLLDFVEHLVDWAGAVPLLVVCTARPELLARRPGWGGGKPNAATVSLSPLSDDDTARLLAALLRRAVIPAEVQAALLERAGGNPLYAEEFVRMVDERGLDPATLDLPESVQGIIAARLDGLEQEDKRLLQDAAVVGKVFWLGALTAHGDRDRWDAERRLHELERRQFVRRERRSSVAGETEYAFWHVLVRDVAYGQIPRARRAERHRRAGEWLSSLSGERSEDRADLLAHHYLAALEYAQAAGLDEAELRERARLATRAAGDRALSLNAFASAIQFYSRAVELWPADDPERPRILLGLGRALFNAEERGAEELEEARVGLVASGDPERAAEAETLLGEIAWMAGNPALTLGHVERAAALVADRPPSPAKAYVLANQSRYLMLAARSEEAISVGRDALAMATALGLEELTAHALDNIGTARAERGDWGGTEDIARAIAIAEPLGSHETVRGLINLASITALFGDLRGCRRHHERGLAVARRLNQARGIRFLESELATDDYLAGEWDSALRANDRFLAEVEAGSPHYMEQACRSTRAMIRMGRGDDAGALADARRALEQAREQAEPQSLLPTLSTCALVALETGDTDWARSCAEELLRSSGSGHLAFGAFPGIIVVDRLGMLPSATAWATEGRNSRWDDAARQYLAGDRSGTADILAEIGALTDEALVRLRSAEVLSAEGRRAEAERHRAAAVEFFRRVGATRYLGRAEQLHAASA